MKNYVGKAWRAEPLHRILEHEELFFKWKHRYESLGPAIMLKNDLFLTRLENEARLGFFQHGLFKDFDWSKKGTWINAPKQYHQYQMHIENYTKLVWLSNDYIKGNGFKNPVGVHYNPHMEKWIVHPGGSRKKVLYYFGPNEIQVLAYNNCGQKVNFERVFNSLDEIKQWYNNDDVKIVCTADHGSLIPHVHFDQKIIDKNIEHWFYQIKEFYKTTVLETNFDLEKHFGYNEKKIVTNPVNTVKVRVSNPNDLDMLDKAMILLPSFSSYNDHGVKIESA